MDNVKNDDYYIEKIVEDLKFIVKQNELLLDSMLFRLIQISESVRKLDDDYKEKHPAIPWTAIYGLRNRIVHDYGNVDLGIVYATLKDDIPDLLKLMTESCY